MGMPWFLSCCCISKRAVLSIRVWDTQADLGVVYDRVQDSKEPSENGVDLLDVLVFRKKERPGKWRQRVPLFVPVGVTFAQAAHFRDG